MLTTNWHLQVTPDGCVSDRRLFLKQIAAGTAGLSAIGWLDAVRLEAAQLRKKGMACILLFQRGAPSQFETFDPKPGTATGGPTKAISTSVPGIEIAEGWEKTAKQMKHIALLRSVFSREGNHERAVYLLHTSYAPSGSVKHPGLGSIISNELSEPNFDLPHFVSIGPGANLSPSYLGMSYAPFVVQDPNRMPMNVELPSGVDASRLKRRLGLVDKLSKDFAEAGGKIRVEDQQALQKAAASMVTSPRIKAFDLSLEKDAVRDRYGRSTFGQGCLLARRLVETGVTCVEVAMGGWDTHDDNFNRTKRLAEQNDPAFASLVEDLAARGMLDRTLVIWMGEFGRTPNINARTGRDHYPRAFSVAVAGGGLKGGMVIGNTGKDGREIKDRPISVQDLFCTIYEALDINPRKEHISAEKRPMKYVDGGESVKELLKKATVKG